MDPIDLLADNNNAPSPSNCFPFCRTAKTPAMNDPLRVVRVTASDGKSGESRELAYTNCKVIGNGSFGVVFQARVVSGGNGNLVEGAGASQDQGAAGSTPKDSQEDVAIKKVLQDKRFKVSSTQTSVVQKRQHRQSQQTSLEAVILRSHSLDRTSLPPTRQNRELQIMRIVKHPNVVDLRAFFYSNGDKVSCS